MLAWLRSRWQEGALIAANGSAVLLLAAAGLLDTVSAPVTGALIPIFRQLFPRLALDEQRSLVEHDRILMSNRIVGDTALVIRAIERVGSVEVARWLAKIIDADRISGEELAADAMIAEAPLWLEQRFTHQVRITDLAGVLAISHQTLIRRFVKALGCGGRIMSSTCGSSPRRACCAARTAASIRFQRLSTIATCALFAAGSRHIPA